MNINPIVIQQTICICNVLDANQEVLFSEVWMVTQEVLKCIQRNYVKPESWAWPYWEHL